MNYTIFIPQILTDTFHAIVDTVSCIMHYEFDILSDVLVIIRRNWTKISVFTKPITNNVFIFIVF